MKSNMRFYFRIAVCYAIAVTVLNVALVWHLKKVNDSIGPKSGLSEGDTAPAFASVSSTGNAVQVAFGTNQPKRVLCFLRTTCPYSVASLPFWRKLASDQKMRGYQVVAIVTDGDSPLQKITDKLGPALPVITVDPDILEQFRIESVPQTVVVDKTGKVLFNHVGTVGDWTLDEMKGLL